MSWSAASGQPANAEPALARVAVDVQRRADGSLVLRNGLPLEKYPPTLPEPLRHWARVQPEAPFLREREGAGWRTIGYDDFLRHAERRAGQLLTLGCSAEKPLLILAQNSIEHALTIFAGLLVGIPVSSVSPAYCQASTFERLQQIIEILGPGAAYVADPNGMARALPTVRAAVKGPVVSHAHFAGVPDLSTIEPLDVAAVNRAAARVGPDTVAKVLFTSGSTGAPKGVINTHRMMCSNMGALVQLWPFLAQRKPSLVDWLPWSHTFGGNMCFDLVLFHGGVMHIDDGRPTPALVGRMIENLKLSPPNLYFSVPTGIEALLPQFETDAALARSFFENAQVIFVAAAALPQRARERMAALALKTTGRKPTLLGGWGSTETAPLATCVYFATGNAGNLGVPIPGTAVKMTPDQGKMALSVQGPNVTPGYWNNPQATREAFDDEGFYRMGDAGKLLDAAAPEQGIAFDGRLAENFKLRSGTWVNVGMLRVAVIDQLRPLCIDAVVTGENEEAIGLLLIPNQAHAAQLHDTTPEQLSPAKLASGPFGRKVREGLQEYNARQSGGSTRVRMAAILSRPPDLSHNEITDKGYVNQRAMRSNWAALIEQLHSEAGDADAARGILRW